jgi:hypothetical protein
LLFIIWDDYINEPISALTNPNSGLLTDNSFYQESRFENVDGVILIRHIHQFFRNLRFGEIINYGVPDDRVQHDSFNYFNPAVTPVFIQNWFGRNISKLHVFVFSAFSAHAFETYTEIPVAEYQRTDFIDWKRGLSFSGIYSLPEKLRYKLISFILKIPTEIPLSYLDIALFDNFSIGKVYMDLLKEYSNDDEIEEVLFEDIKTFINIRKSSTKLHLKELSAETKRHYRTDQQYMNHFTRIWNVNSYKNCPCYSGEFFGDCCKEKLKFFKYTHYYDL